MGSSCTCNTTRDIYVPQAGTLTKVERMTRHEVFLEVKLDSGKPLGHMPGQFVEVSVPGIGEAPISVSSAPGTDTFDMVIRNVGRLTAALHEYEAGSKIGIRGPFGSIFPVEDAMKGRDLIFICGGIGLVPVRSAINYVLEHREDYGKVTILYGSKSPAEQLFHDELGQWRERNDVTYLDTVDRADDHWKGNVGVITTLIPKISFDPQKTLAIVCGPPIMYKFVIVELYGAELPAENVYVSLERRMKCGVGKCGHCQINGLYTCIDGPVFRYADVADVQEAI
jgi:sulfite reductase subunit B